MRLNIQPSSACIGDVQIQAVSRVVELDAVQITGPNKIHELTDGTLSVCFSHESLQVIEKQLAIVVPCMNEERAILEGVLRGIPHDCFIVLVSNSDTDNFRVERTMLTGFCNETQRQAVVIHQQDAGLARAFLEADMPHIINTARPQQSISAGRIRNGKGEAMMIGTALAKLAGKQFVGFIDADNFVPGAVHEYCKVFAAGLNQALHSSDYCSSDENDEPLAMVRIKWKCKPKIVDGKLVSKESGRCSRIVNAWMNHLLNTLTGNTIHANFIETANAGEHAMSIDLALQLNFATGYAVEPFQLINAWERSGIFPSTPPSTPSCIGDTGSMPVLQAPLSRKVKIMQIETLNPHIHDFGKGEEHILRMQAQGLGTVYHSRLMPQTLKDDLQDYMKGELSTVVSEDGVVEQARVYPPLEAMNFGVFERVLKASADTMQVLKSF